MRRRSALTGSPKNPHRGQTWVGPVAAAVATGFTLSVAGFLLVATIEDAATRSLMERRAATQTKALQGRINEDLAGLGLVGSVYRVNRPTGLDRFDLLLKEFVEATDDLHAIAWSPRVPAAERAAFEAAAPPNRVGQLSIYEIGADGRPRPATARNEYFPLYVLEPRGDDDRAIGFDLASDPIALEALTRSRSTGAAAASLPVDNPLWRDGAAGRGILAFVPTYGDGAANEQGQAADGFVVGALSIADLVRSALRDATLPAGFDRYVYDGAEPDRLVYFSASRMRTAPPAPVASGQVRTGRYIETVLRIADREWKVVFRPIEGTYPARSWPSLSVLGFGLTLTALLGYYLFVTATQRDRITRLVAERTRELSAVNTDLAREIDDRERAEQALRRQEAELARTRQQLIDAIESLTEGFALYDAEDRLVLYNSNYRDMYPLDPEMFTPGTRFEDHLRAGLACGFVAGAVGREEAWIAERLAQHRDPGGPVEQPLTSGRWLQVNERRTRDGGYVGVRSDITERKRAETALRESQAMLRAVIDAVPAVIHVNDREGRYVLVNAYHADYHGMPIEALVGKTAFDLATEDAARMTSARERAIFETGQAIGLYEESYQERDGRTSTWLSTKAPLRDAAGAVKYVVGVGFDISERKRLESDLLQAQKMTAVGELSSGIAHDFNNLLTALYGSLELLGDRLSGNPDTGELIQTALRAVERGADLTHRLLAFSRRQPLKPETIDVNGLVLDLLELLRRTLGEQIDAQTHLAPDLALASVDRSQLENAVLNLALNARDAMPNGGKLIVETANAHLDENYALTQTEVAPGDYVLIAVSDSGVGMPPSVAARAFEPFFTTKGVGRGSGLGLSMVYGFVKQSGGHAKIYSEPGHGTTVKLYLPKAPDGQPATPPAPTAGGPSGGDETVMVVEDDPDVRTNINTLLSAQGYHVIEAEHGAAALALLDAHPNVDLLLTDVVLPGGMNGRDVAEAVQRRCPGVAVLYTSGYTENVIFHQGRLDPDIELIGKPYRKTELIQRIRRLLDGRKA